MTIFNHKDKFHINLVKEILRNADNFGIGRITALKQELREMNQFIVSDEEIENLAFNVNPFN